MVKKVNALVLRVAGTNCDRETCYALKTAGADSVDRVHLNELIRHEKTLDKYHIIAFPGGFSYGDDVSAGKIFATQIEYKLSESMKAYNESGRLIIGICNGFQVLVKLNLLPGIGKYSATLGWNNSGKFECRWIYLKRGKNLWTRGLPEVIQFPIAHAEGKFIVRDNTVLNKLKKNGQIAFQYVDEKGAVRPSYPYNPNGSVNNIAGVTNPKGNVFGLMPHPERSILKYQNPAWTRMKSSSKPDITAGLKIFMNAVEHARKKL